MAKSLWSINPWKVWHYLHTCTCYFNFFINYFIYPIVTGRDTDRDNNTWSTVTLIFIFFFSTATDCDTLIFKFFSLLLPTTTDRDPPWQVMSLIVTSILYFYFLYFFLNLSISWTMVVMVSHLSIFVKSFVEWIILWNGLYIFLCYLKWLQIKIIILFCMHMLYIYNNCKKWMKNTNWLWVSTHAYCRPQKMCLGQSPLKRKWRASKRSVTFSSLHRAKVNIWQVKITFQ